MQENNRIKLLDERRVELPDGAIVHSKDSHSVIYRKAEKEMDILRERHLFDGHFLISYVYLPPAPSWSNGTMLSSDEIKDLRANLTEAFIALKSLCIIRTLDEKEVREVVQ